MDTETLPRWGWLLIGLFIAMIVGQLLNHLLLFPWGLPEAYQVVTIITLMAPVIVYMRVWFDGHRQQYREHSRARIAGDVGFVLLGTIVGSSIALVAVVDTGVPTMLADLIAMAVGFVFAWVLFWWRNVDIYRD
ncbi:hypothetical protein [Natronobeatus ordinarius]|uniref:hypothetical protein n=1 Tax=Natronobeatus ordinarius TaxID=2963433 RepID=UPI0020CE1F2E|nr:hypothetical protein [Natronobeatus ordinarius]